jgi:ABC-type glycerol-3-phosphate transport system substrate-binding protein
MSDVARTNRLNRRSLLKTAIGTNLMLAGVLAPRSVRRAAAQDSPPSTTLTTEPVTLDLYIETGFDLPGRLAEEFTRQFPNVTFDIRRDQFEVITENGPRVMTTDDAPDFIRIPQLVGPAQDGLLLNLDPYYEAYGWSTWSQSLLDQMRVGEDGIRGHGSLYGLGLGYNVTGVFYNKQLATQIGMTTPPATVAEFEALLVKAKEAGLQPITQFNDIGGVAFPYQALLNQFQDPATIAAWIYQQPDANFNTPGAVKAAEYTRRWGELGYFPADANALDYTTAMGRFIAGEGVFIFNGDWESANLDKGMTDNAGFFLFPPEEAGGQFVAMSAPATYVIPAKAKHPDEMVFFLNWAHTNEVARNIIVQTTGSSPGGPADLPLPDVPEGSVTAQTLTATNTLAQGGVAIDFIANATPGIYAGAFRPELQLLITGKVSPEDFAANIQEAYEEELER